MLHSLVIAELISSLEKKLIHITCIQIMMENVLIVN